MCDPYGETRNWRLYIRDMIDFGERVLSYTVGLDQYAFVADMRTYAAIRHSGLDPESRGDAVRGIPVNSSYRRMPVSRGAEQGEETF